MVYLSAKWFIILLNSSSIWLQMYKEIQTNCGQRQWHCAKDPFQMELKVKIGTKVILKYNVNTSDGLNNGARGDLLGINSINYPGRNPRDMAQRGQRPLCGQGPHTSAPQTRGSPNNAGSRGNAGSHGQWRGRTPHRGRSSRASRGAAHRGRTRGQCMSLVLHSDPKQVKL